METADHLLSALAALVWLIAGVVVLRWLWSEKPPDSTPAQAGTSTISRYQPGVGFVPLNYPSQPPSANPPKYPV